MGKQGYLSYEVENGEAPPAAKCPGVFKKEGHLVYIIENWKNGRARIRGCDRKARGELVIPDTIKRYIKRYPVTSIYDFAFEGCSSLTSITIPESVTSIGRGAFDGCTSLTSITIPDGGTWIGNHAFNGCSSLTSVTIGNGMTRIDDYAFYGCTSLTSITIRGSVTRIGECAFKGCTSLTSITFKGNAPKIQRWEWGSDRFHSKAVEYEGTFAGVTATAYYPADNDTWTKFDKVEWWYGGHITWVPYERHAD